MAIRKNFSDTDLRINEGSGRVQQRKKADLAPYPIRSYSVPNKKVVRTRPIVE